MKNKFFSNIGLKLMSLILGFVVWIVVLNIDDYSTTRQITDIEVTIINADAITDQNQLYDITSGETVDIIVKGRRSVVDSLDASDFTAVADLSKLSITNAVNITVTANSSSVEEAITITIIDNVMQVELEEEESVSLPVTVTTTGEPADGYTTGIASATPNLIVVTGAASVVDRISMVEVTVDVTDRSSDVNATCTPVFYDGNGDEISANKLECEVTDIDVTVPIYKTKDVKIILETTGAPADNYEIVSIEYGPDSVTIGADTDTLKGISSITIDDLDVSGLTGDLETTIDLSKYLPDGVVIAGDTTSVSVQVIIERIISRSISLSASDITITNKTADYDYDISFDDENVVVISGLSDEISDLTAKDLDITIDGETLTQGTNTVTPEIADTDTYTVDDVCTVTIEVTAMP